jgi:hypothetical protein
MNTTLELKRIPKILIVLGILIALGGGALAARTAWASYASNNNPEPAGMTLPYPGRLSVPSGEPAADGRYDFAFSLYAAETGGEELWSEMQKNVPVSAGEFALSLGSLSPIPDSALNGAARWLEVAVRGLGEADFTRLQPRQFLSSSPDETAAEAANAAPAAAAAGAACPHTHFGESWSGNGVYGLFAETTSGNLGGALYGRTYGIGGGVYGEAIGASSINAGVWGTSNSTSGSGGKFTNTSTGDALYAENLNSGIAVHVKGNGAGNTKAALRVENNSGLAAYLTNTSGNPTLEIDKTNPGGAAIDLQLFNPGNVDPAMFIKAFDENTVLQFLVSTTGVVAANGYVDWGGADMAEMLPAAEGLEAGDVLAIGSDGKLTLSNASYQTSVAGVYSTDPGFTFGQSSEGEIPGTIPLAIAGVVPVKVSAENGPITPGDLLVSSSTPGYAMRSGLNPPQGTVIGKALSALDEGAGVIQALVTLQ